MSKTLPEGTNVSGVMLIITMYSGAIMDMNFSEGYNPNTGKSARALNACHNGGFRLDQAGDPYPVALANELQNVIRQPAVTHYGPGGVMSFENIPDFLNFPGSGISPGPAPSRFELFKAANAATMKLRAALCAPVAGNFKADEINMITAKNADPKTWGLDQGEPDWNSDAKEMGELFFKTLIAHCKFSKVFRHYHYLFVFTPHLTIDEALEKYKQGKLIVSFAEHKAAQRGSQKEESKDDKQEDKQDDKQDDKQVKEDETDEKDNGDKKVSSSSTISLNLLHPFVDMILTDTILTSSE